MTCEDSHHPSPHEVTTLGKVAKPSTPIEGNTICDVDRAWLLAGAKDLVERKHRLSATDEFVMVGLAQVGLREHQLRSACEVANYCARPYS